MHTLGLGWSSWPCCCKRVRPQRPRRHKARVRPTLRTGRPPRSRRYRRQSATTYLGVRGGQSGAHKRSRHQPRRPHRPRQEPRRRLSRRLARATPRTQSRPPRPRQTWCWRPATSTRLHNTRRPTRRTRTRGPRPSVRRCLGLRQPACCRRLTGRRTSRTGSPRSCHRCRSRSAPRPSLSRCSQTRERSPPQRRRRLKRCRRCSARQRRAAARLPKATPSSQRDRRRPRRGWPRQNLPTCPSSPCTCTRARCRRRRRRHHACRFQARQRPP